jgi:hypothetical protein
MTTALELTEPTPPSPNPLFPLNTPDYSVEINLRPSSDRPIWSRHTLRKPTLDQLAQRDRETSVSLVEHGHEEEIQAETDGPNIRLYDALFLRATGYRPDGQAHEGAEAAKSIPVSHKLAVMNGLYLTDESVLADDEDSEFFDLEKVGSVRIKQGIGPGKVAPFELVHTFREPTPKERRQYREAAGAVRIVRGRQQRTKVMSNLKGVVAIYDALIQSVEGANTTDLKAIKEQLDPVFKSKAVAKAMTALDAALQD